MVSRDRSTCHAPHLSARRVTRTPNEELSAKPKNNRLTGKAAYKSAETGLFSITAPARSGIMRHGRSMGNNQQGIVN
jgi:hypothetical protein